MKKAVPSWVQLGSKEVEMLISKLYKEGKMASQIGLVLRDSYGIPDVKLLTKKSITKILDEKGLKSELPEDLLSLVRTAATLVKHMEKNRQDKTALRGIQLAESKIGKITKYYKRTGKVPETWKYRREEAGMYLG